jgi:hypothetical protein
VHAQKAAALLASTLNKGKDGKPAFRFPVPIKEEHKLRRTQVAGGRVGAPWQRLSRVVCLVKRLV